MTALGAALLADSASFGTEGLFASAAVGLTALAAVPPSVTAFMGAHATAVTKAAAKTASQWKNWYWICFGGIIFFLFTVPLMKGRWSPSAAKKDEEEHEALVQTELAKLAQAGVSV